MKSKNHNYEVPNNSDITGKKVWIPPKPLIPDEKINITLRKKKPILSWWSIFLLIMFFLYIFLYYLLNKGG